MAKLIIKDTQYEIPDGSRILEPCEAAGVPFNCHAGNCGTCQIEVQTGPENLLPVNRLEEDMGMGRFNRLACQCRIKTGTVKITY